MSLNLSWQNVFQLLEDIPFAQFATAAATDFENIPADISAVETTVMAAVKDIFNGGTTATAATAAVNTASSVVAKS